MLHLALLGATGKMGQRILELALQDPELHITSANLSALLQCDVAIDFTLPEATENHLNAAIQARKPLVLGTTGHDEKQTQAIHAAAQFIPLLYSPNFSLGIALCLEVASYLSKALSPSCTINILETHHAHKKDSPSGTARALAQAISNQLPIAIHSIRTGDVVGEHTVTFTCGHETIELKHTAHSRDAFASGALIGAKFLATQPPGLYTLRDLYSAPSSNKNVTGEAHAEVRASKKF
jgi:4-hydroxy-tetrahydrodipicolinate reductase